MVSQSMVFIKSDFSYDRSSMHSYVHLSLNILMRTLPTSQRCMRTEGANRLHQTQQTEQFANVINTHIVWQGSACPSQKGKIFRVQHLVAVDDGNSRGDCVDHIRVDGAACSLRLPTATRSMTWIRSLRFLR